MRARVWWITTLALLAVGVAMAAPYLTGRDRVLAAPITLPGAAPAASASPCPTTEILAFRGSGEGVATGEQPIASMMGPTLARVLSAARLQNGAMAFVPVFGVPYPAVPAGQFLAQDQTNLLQSVTTGRLLADGYMRLRHDACPQLRFVLAGYSQGVLAARSAAMDVPESWVAGVFGIGDPLQRAESPGVVGAGADGNGLLRRLLTGDDPPSTDTFYRLGLRTFLFCHASDAVCDATHAIPADLLGQHVNYGENPAEARTLGQALAQLTAPTTNTSEFPRRLGALG